MRAINIPWYRRIFRIFKPRLRPYLVDSKYKVIPAFSIGGEDYFMFESTNEVPAGRFMAAMGIYAEMEMNCDKEYLKMHVAAMEKILSDPKKISIQYILQLNIHLKERVELMPMPSFMYKLASVIFFDKSESLYAYDYDYNKKKIEKWKAAGGTLDFFSKTPLKELLPHLMKLGKDSQTYLTALNLIDETHRQLHTTILSEGK